MKPFRISISILRKRNIWTTETRRRKEFFFASFYLSVFIFYGIVPCVALLYVIAEGSNWVGTLIISNSAKQVEMSPSSTWRCKSLSNSRQYKFSECRHVDEGDISKIAANKNLVISWSGDQQWHRSMIFLISIKALKPFRISISILRKHSFFTTKTQRHEESVLRAFVHFRHVDKGDISEIGII